MKDLTLSTLSFLYLSFWLATKQPMLRAYHKGSLSSSVTEEQAYI